MSETEPSAVRPWVAQLWRQHHTDKPLVTIRCAAKTKQGKCCKPIGSIWETPRGLLAALRQTQSGREMQVPLEGAMTEEELEQRILARDQRFARVRPDGTGHSKRASFPPVAFMLEMGMTAMPVACPDHGPLQYDADGLLAVCRLAQSGRRRAPSAWLAPISGSA